MEELEKELEEYKKESERKIKELEEKIEKLKKEGKEKSKVWEPKKNEDYWYFDGCGYVYDSTCIPDCIDRDRYSLGNYFKTKEEAEKALEKIKIYTKLKRFALEYNTEKIDFTDDDKEKCCIIYITDRDSLFIEQCLKDKDIGQIYFSDEEIAERAIEEIGEENIKKLFNWRDKTNANN